MDSKNDNDKANVPSFPLPEPTVNYFDDLDYLKDFENEFSAIVYNDALTSKSNFLSEPTVNPQHIDEFSKTSLSECDDEEQNVLYFNDLFPFNIIYPDGLNRMGTMMDVNLMFIELSSGFSIMAYQNSVDNGYTGFNNRYHGDLRKEIDELVEVFTNLEDLEVLES
ncbi:hypothetical protein Tco_0509548 [Tanacetum coccineum]